MRRISAMALSLALWAQPVFADKYGSFQEFADSGSLEPFARDLGGLLGSATFHGARSLGFSGFDVGPRYVTQFQPSKNNQILRRRGVKEFGLPWVQAEVGMPYRMDGFIRGMSFEGLTVVGGGLRFGVLPISDKRWAPQLLISGYAHAVVHRHFSITHQGASLVFAMGVPQFTPYIGGGFDRTSLLVRSSTLDPTLNGVEVTTIESRMSAGFQIRPFPVDSQYHFLYLHAAYALLHGQHGGEGGLGFRF